MSLLNTTNFERQGNTENDLYLESTEDIQQTIIDLSENALKSIRIFTPDLEHELYNNDKFRQKILQLSRGNRHAQVQILVADSTQARNQGHRLLRLSQQITSVMQIRLIPEEYKELNISFILVDQSNFIYRTPASKQPALYSSCKNRINKLQEFFTSIWEHAEQDPNTQSFHI